MSASSKQGRGLSADPWLMSAFQEARRPAALSVVGAPVAVVAGHQATSDEQDEVHEPPDAQASQGE